ncbi:MAG: endonuclease/exonuclease/phosphatase family protein [Flavobacterium sp.]|nr:endonuclease/exonuclease/phosphatase family protein [Flavobacterium sp.]
MAKAIVTILKNATKTFTLATTAIYIAASLTPYINPIYCSIFTFLALAFPYILLAMVLASFLAFFCFKKYAWMFVLLLLVGTKNIIATTGFHRFTATFKQKKPIATLRLLSWNVNEFYPSERIFDTANSPRQRALAFIKKINADVICLQDFHNYPNDERYRSNILYIRDSLEYQYYYCSVDRQSEHMPSKDDFYGSIIFSKFPIVDTGKTAYNSNNYLEHLAFAEILIGQKKIRFYNAHLSSMQLTTDRKNAGLIYTYIQDDTAILFNKRKLERIAIFDSFHVKQAQIVKQQLNKSPLPFVFCADLNSVPSSYVYHHISSGLQDAFLQKGFGWGPTYDGLSHTLRIDVTLLSPQLKVVQHYCPKLKASDHYPLVTDIALP